MPLFIALSGCENDTDNAVTAEGKAARGLFG